MMNSLKKEIFKHKEKIPIFLIIGYIFVLAGTIIEIAKSIKYNTSIHLGGSIIALAFLLTLNIWYIVKIKNTEN